MLDLQLMLLRAAKKGGRYADAGPKRKKAELQMYKSGRSIIAVVNGTGIRLIHL